MTTAEREIMSFIAKNEPVAMGTIREHFLQWDVVDVLRRLESAGLVSCEMRPTVQGECPFYRINPNSLSATGRENETQRTNINP
jgi:hypothetical protein